VLYNGVRDHYALRDGHVFPILGRRGITVSAISGIDMALWDLLGKSLDAPVWRLLGGRKAERMPAYASGGWADAAGIGKQLTELCRARRLPAVKMRVGVIDGAVRNSVARVKAAREALGPDIGLMCDAHGTYTVADAKQFCRLVEDCDLTWFEEPVTGDDKRGLAEVRASTVGADRGRRKRIHPLRLPRHRAARRRRLLPARPGDLRRHQRGDAHRRHRQRLQPAPGATPVDRRTGVRRRPARDGGLPGRLHPRVLAGRQPAAARTGREKFTVRDGMIEIPDRPGLGVTVDESFVQRYAVPFPG
jgi:L-alanine-DL-glutamate epimerase-like enolase superfamily enzyme